ncbi:MAG: hypothetical protein JXB00_03535 [Bacteroidales bacterium]|nr:hypothetical protein [Bacteroidales bacterium]
MASPGYISHFYFFLLIYSFVPAQNVYGKEKDFRININTRTFIPYDSINSILFDTVFTFLDNKNSFFDMDDSLKIRTENFYDTLKNRAGHRRITRELFDLIVITPSEHNELNAIESEVPFIEYNNKIIRSISFMQLPVFGPTVDDTTIQAKRFYEKAGNKMHINSSKRILSRSLLIKPGDRLNAYKLADNERILRSLPYIQDARFIVKQTHPLSDSVDIITVIKDLWSLGFSMDLSGTAKGNFNIWHKNLLGLGNEEQNNIYWDTGQKNLLGYEGTYRISNLAGTFIKSEFRYAGYFGTRQLYADFQRKFFTPEVKYAGGLRLETKKTLQDIILIDTTLEKTRYSFTSYDAWIGRAFPLEHQNLLSRKRSNIMVAGRIFNISYHDRPETTEKYLYTFHNRLQILATAAFSIQGFYKSHLVYGFGQTEDIPYGYLFQVIGGYEHNEFFNRPYFGLTLSQGTYLWRTGGYLFNRFETGGYLTGNNFEQGLFGITTTYFTPLLSWNRYKLRYFLTFKYKTGIQRFRDEYLSIENKQGLTGLYSTKLKGIQKMTLNLEAVTFTPYYLLGFRFVFFSFANLGLVGPGGKSVFSNNLYSGLGFGLRIRNERLVFNTLQIKFAFYPLAPEHAEWQYIQVSGEQKLQMENFYISDPRIIEY